MITSGPIPLISPIVIPIFNFVISKDYLAKIIDISLLMAHHTKKSLGQHFLNDQFLAESIVQKLQEANPERVLEVGPGQGVLTQYLIKGDYDFKAIELDDQLVPYL